MENIRSDLKNIEDYIAIDLFTDQCRHFLLLLFFKNENMKPKQSNVVLTLS